MDILNNSNDQIKTVNLERIKESRQDDIDSSHGISSETSTKKLLPEEQHNYILDHLLSIDFSKHIDIIGLCRLKNFDLTEEEEETQVDYMDMLKIIKILMYRIGINEERNNLHLKDLDTKTTALFEKAIKRSDESL